MDSGKFVTLTPSDSEGIGATRAVLIEKSGSSPAVVKLSVIGGPPETDTPVTITSECAKLVLALPVTRVYATGTSGAVIYGLY